uniref:Peptidase S1 domain-containing protein n=1 Tax=Branchiostoma floridae TaxID=7739 RepID=C3Y3E6_BRAFL|eukprot:XP_002609203.1 hypothetical protein BRAFLDRAFT_90656 [Branchiostoma floridae]
MWRVRAGLTSVVTWEDGREDYNVSRVILHPAYHEFTIGSQDVAHHDVALIKLARSVRKPYVRSTSESERLKWTYAPLLDPAYCSKDHVWGTLEVSSIQVCAGYEHGRDDACDGDSGGPLICPSPDGSRWELHGIVNWGEQPCGDPHKPTMYARVTAFKSWIEQTIQSN